MGKNNSEIHQESALTFSWFSGRMNLWNVFKYIFFLSYHSRGMSTNLKWHNFKAIFTIHQVNITVKFPCSVTMVLKVGTIAINERFQIVRVHQRTKTCQW